MKDKKRYLIAQWNPKRGQTGPEDGCLFCGGCVFQYPLQDIDADLCYKSEKQAVKQMEKHRGYNWMWGYKYEVVEVPQSALKNGG